MERTTWTLERIGMEAKFVLLQLAGVLYGSFAKHFSPVMSLLCLIALLSMHALSRDGVVSWNEIRMARGWALCDLLLSKLGEVILISVAISWQFRFSFDFLCIITDRFVTYWIGPRDRMCGEFFHTFLAGLTPLRQFEYFCHIFFIYYMIILLNAMHNMPLE